MAAVLRSRLARCHPLFTHTATLLSRPKSRQLCTKSPRDTELEALKKNYARLAEKLEALEGKQTVPAPAERATAAPLASTPPPAWSFHIEPPRDWRKDVVEPLKRKLSRDRLNHLEATFRSLALVQTDVLVLQSLLTAASTALTVRTSQAPVKTASYYAAFFALLSGMATFKLASERFVWLSEAEETIYKAHFGEQSGPGVTRPMFKKLLRCATITTCKSEKRIITRGEPAPLVLLLEGSATIAASFKSSWGVVGQEANLRRRQDVEPQIEILRGRGFYGEVSFVHSMTSLSLGEQSDHERVDPIEVHSVSAATLEDPHLPRADVTMSAGSRIIIWDGDKLREMLRKDRSLANALMSNLAVTISNKLYDSTSSIDKATTKLQHSRSKRDEAEYAHAALGITLHTLLGTLEETIELVRQAGKAGKMTEALTAPGTGHKLHFSLEVLRRKNATVSDEHERVLKDLNLLRPDEPVYGPEAPSLLELCQRVAAKHDVKQRTFNHQLSLGADSHKRSRVVRQDTKSKELDAAGSIGGAPKSISRRSSDAAE